MRGGGVDEIDLEPWERHLDAHLAEVKTLTRAIRTLTRDAAWTAEREPRPTIRHAPQDRNPEG